MYIDEAHTLAEKKPIEGSESLYDLMKKAAADFCDQPFFILFLSTTPELYVPTTPTVLSNPAKMFQVTSTLVPPFTELPFDCHPELQTKIQPGLKLEVVQAFPFSLHFGRPL